MAPSSPFIRIYKLAPPSEALLNEPGRLPAVKLDGPDEPPVVLILSLDFGVHD